MGTQLYIYSAYDQKYVPVSLDHPLPSTIIQKELPPVSGRTITRIVKVPGIGTGSAYDDGDAFGTRFIFPALFDENKKSGTIMGAFLIDLDDEGLALDIALFVRSFTATTDNDAFAISDDDIMAARGVVKFATTDFSNWNANQFGQLTNLNIPIVSDSGNLYAQCIARGALNIAAGKEPWVAITVWPD